MSLFITGTDTSAGKTVVAASLMRGFKNKGDSVVGMKPIASGARATPEGLRNDDALCLMREATTAIAYDTVNPYVFAPPVAPHVAAAATRTRIEFARIERALADCRRAADIVVVEGVGGWMVPLGEERWLSDLVRALALPVVMVVGLRLGCINHAMLTAQSITNDGLPLLGWVANAVAREYMEAEATLGFLRAHIDAPLLGILPWLPQPDFDDLADILMGGFAGLEV